MTASTCVGEKVFGRPSTWIWSGNLLAWEGGGVPVIKDFLRNKVEIFVDS